jgi:hypothetical protein
MDLHQQHLVQVMVVVEIRMTPGMIVVMMKRTMITLMMKIWMNRKMTTPIIVKQSITSILRWMRMDIFASWWRKCCTAAALEFYYEAILIH